GACGREQEFSEVADHVLTAAADVDELGAGTDHLDQRGVGIELAAELVEVRNLQAGPEPYRAAVGRDLAEHQLEQRGLAGAVRPDDSDLVAAQDAAGEVAHHDAWALIAGERLRYVLELGDELARELAAVHIEPYPAHALAPFGAL